MLVFLGVMSNVASDVGYVVLIPLGAMVFLACGRHPIAGIAPPLPVCPEASPPIY